MRLQALWRVHLWVWRQGDLQHSLLRRGRLPPQLLIPEIIRFLFIFSICTCLGIFILVL